MSNNVQVMLIYTLVAAILGFALIAISCVMLKKSVKATGRKLGPGWGVAVALCGVALLFFAWHEGKCTYRTHVAEKEAEAQALADAQAAADKAAAEEKAAAEAAEKERAAKEAEDAKKAAEQAAAEAEQSEAEEWDYPGYEDGLLPPVHIDVTTYRFFKEYREDVARRGTRGENAKWKARIAELNGYKCSDAVSIPVYMDLEFFNQLNQVFPDQPITYDTLKGVDLNDEEACLAALEEQYKLDKAAWSAMNLKERNERSIDERRRDIINDPVIGIGWYEMLKTENKIVDSYPEIFAKIDALIEKAYSEDPDNPEKPYGVDYFLVYDTEEHAEQELEQYSHTTTEYYEVIGAPINELMRVAFDPYVFFGARKTSKNMCLPPTPLDSHCRLQFASYQESRASQMLPHYGKNGEELYRFGSNNDDRRPTRYSLAAPASKQEKVAPKAKQTQQTSQSTTSNTPDNTEPDPGNPPDDTPGDTPTPTPEPGCTPDQEPTQDGSGGDQDGGDNRGNEDGGDQDHGDARKDEKDDSDNNKGDNGNPGDGTGDSGNPGGGDDNGQPGDSTVHDPGTNPNPPEDKGPQQGQEGSTGGPVNTGTV